MKRSYQLSVAIISIMLILSTTACGLAGQVDKPVVQISVPDEQFVAGLPIAVQVTAADMQGLAYVELMVDGQPFTTIPANPNETSLVSSQFWTPELPGSHVIQARAFNNSNLVSDPVYIMVSVGEAAVETESAAQIEELEQPVSAAEVIQASAGDTIEPAIPAVANEPVNTAPTITALVDLNVRTGPGVDYVVVGLLPGGASTEVTGRSVDGTWFEIIYPVNSNTKAWASASSQYVYSVNTEILPVVAAPALPTASPTLTATPQPTATPSPTQAPTNTPVPPTPEPVKPTIYSFTASQYIITKGENVTLQWDLANAQVAFLNYNGSDEGIVAPGSKIVAPTVDTVYTLIAHNEAGDTYAQIEIKVNPVIAEPPGPVFTPVIPIDPGKLVPILPTPTPKFKLIPGVIITPVPTLQMIPGVIIPSP